MNELKIRNSDSRINVGKIVCVGKNYADHAKEMGGEVPEFPIIFLKPASTIIYDGDEILMPDYSNELHYEGEFVLLIGKKVKDADDKTADEAITGYGLGLDMTLRDLQWQYKDKGQPWTLAKCFDTGTVLGDFALRTEHEFKGNERLTLKVNGEIRQDARVDQMTFSPIEIIKYVSHRMTLLPGDLIFTGTPAGVGKVVPGDLIETELEGIGKMTNKVGKA